MEDLLNFYYLVNNLSKILTLRLSIKKAKSYMKFLIFSSNIRDLYQICFIHNIPLQIDTKVLL